MTTFLVLHSLCLLSSILGLPSRFHGFVLRLLRPFSSSPRAGQLSIDRVVARQQ
ncbi:hypothetical protein [Nocardioides sp. Bht2]|uniref:hypothetical protein n=1 Tax=Nocardioides sp. Bht2 TaxID=3392297 RepID=UPI0039B3D6F4